MAQSRRIAGCSLHVTATPALMEVAEAVEEADRSPDLDRWEPEVRGEAGTARCPGPLIVTTVWSVAAEEAAEAGHPPDLAQSGPGSTMGVDHRYALRLQVRRAPARSSLTHRRSRRRRTRTSIPEFSVARSALLEAFIALLSLPVDSARKVVRTSPKWLATTDRNRTRQKFVVARECR
jgi:hypothetical protein